MHYVLQIIPYNSINILKLPQEDKLKDIKEQKGIVK